MAAPKKRLDDLLIERELAEDRRHAEGLIRAGVVFVGEAKIDKPGTQVRDDAKVSVRKKRKYVSRGGLKLEGALNDFALDPNGLVAADLGASTGGFTDCLLQRGAAKVFAVDVGYGLLDYKLRVDERVVVMERTNARNLTADALGEKVDLVVIDASFIGLRKLLPATAAITKDDARVLAMVKPQFEVAREVAEGGVVRDEDVRRGAIDQVAREALALGFQERARTDASIRGPKGNLEAFLLLTR